VVLGAQVAVDEERVVLRVEARPRIVISARGYVTSISHSAVTSILTSP
jgi:hypothetical protein